MQNLSGVKLFAIAILAGLVAVAAGYYYLDLREKQLRNAYAPRSDVTVALVVPRTDLPKGTALTQETLAIKQVPVDYVPSNALTAQQWKQASGRTLVSPVQRGRPITWDAIEGESVDRFSENIELGMRAKTIKISKVNSIDGLLRPGDKVDLYGVFSNDDIGTAKQENFADDVLLLVLENVEVLAAGREDASGRRYENFVDKTSADGFNMSFSTVTLHVSEYQAVKVELAQEAGDLMAVLRNPNDTGETKTRRLRVSDLLNPDPVETVDIVLDKNGKPVGRIVGDKVVDAQGRVVGHVKDGKVVDLNGAELGTIGKGIMSRGTLVAEQELVRDTNGNILGRVVDGKIIDADGKMIGSVKNRKAVGLAGSPIGSVSEQTQPVQVVRDANGNIVGRVVDGKVIDENGNIVGTVKDGVAVSISGDPLGELDEIEEKIQVVRNSSGKIIGRIVDGKVVDNNGYVVGEVKNGVPISIGEKPLGTIAGTIASRENATLSRYIEFIAGGTGKDGVNPVQKVMVE